LFTVSYAKNDLRAALRNVRSHVTAGQGSRLLARLSLNSTTLICCGLVLQKIHRVGLVISTTSASLSHLLWTCCTRSCTI